MSSELFELPEAGASGPTVRLVAADGLPVESADAPGDGHRAAEAPQPTLSATRIADLLGRPRPPPAAVAGLAAPGEPTLVVAGAGSGKTETMAARVVWLIANELVPPDAVLGLSLLHI